MFGFYRIILLAIVIAVVVWFLLIPYFKDIGKKVKPTVKQNLKEFKEDDGLDG